MLVHVNKWNKFLIPLFVIFLSFQAIAQSNYYPKPSHPEWFKAIPFIDESTPEWAVTMYTDDTNFELVEQQKYAYYKNNSYKKTIHIQNYKYWFKIVSNHVNEEGRIELPDPVIAFKQSELEKKKTQGQKMMDTWKNIGPYETINFDGSSLPEARPTQANIFCLGVAESNTNVVYAGAETGGVYKTIDKGLNWFPVSADYEIGSLIDIKVDPYNENIVYICRNNLIYKTINGGTTWSLLYTFPNTAEHLLITKDDTDIIYASTRSGIYKTTDAGITWTNIFSGRFYDIETKPGKDSVLYVAMENTSLKRPEIHKSIDAGNTWTLMDNGYYTPSVPGEATVYGCKIGVTPADPNRIYAGIIANGKAADNGWIGIYYSLDEGATWQEDSGFDGAPYATGSDAATNWYVAGYSSGYHQGFYNFDLDVSHIDPDKLWLGTIWFCESGNKGGNIEYVRGTRNLSMHADIQDIDVHGNEIWIASDGGINYSNDECVTVDTRMKGLYASDYWGFGQGWNVDTWVGGRYHNGNAAFHENYGAGKTLFLGGAEDATGYVNQFDNLKNYHSDIGGRKIPETFDQNSVGITNLGLYPTQSYFHFSYSEIEWDPRYANRVLIGKDNHLYVSKDQGISSSILYTFPDKTFSGTNYNGLIRRFEISRDDPDYIYAIVRYTTWEYRIFKSTDGGVSFIELANPPYSGGSWRDLSITLNPFDKDEIWVASYHSNDGNKIFNSTDGGSSWTGRYSSVISGENIKDLIYQASESGDIVYAMTNKNYFYYDKTANLWTEWTDGLHAAHTGFMTLPFYRDNKIRMASAKGIWEAEMINESKVQALPMVEMDSVFCTKDTIQLESYSIVEHTGTTWQWSFTPAPSWISDANARNPRVSFASSGAYDVSLTITDAQGNTDTRTITDMIGVDNRCEVDSVAGQSLKTIANGDYMVSSDANLTNLTHFTVTGWWKPAGAQEAYSALFSSGDWCAHCTDTEGLIFNYNGDKLWYKWPGEGNPWGSNSGITIPLDEWSYVALVIQPTGATMYLNGEKYTHNRALDPGEISDLHIGYGHYSKSFKGEIDEVTVWNRALTDDEVYRLRHITKEEEVANDPDLIAYYQFNNLFRESQILDHGGTLHGSLKEGASLTTSRVPVGKGEAEIIELDANQNKYNFSNTETEVFLSECENLEGKMVISRINVEPDTLPLGISNPENYWIINHYDGLMPSIDSLWLSPQNATFVNTVGNATKVGLFKRSENAEGSIWDAASKGIEFQGNKILFDRKINIKERTQISLTEFSENFDEFDPGKPCEADTIAGKLLTLAGNGGDYLSIPAMNLNSNTITMSAWVKSEGLQNSWAGIIFARAGNTTAGISAANGDNELRYHWNGNEYNWSSGAYLPVDKWAHVAMVIKPDSVIIYLDGVAYSRARTHAAEEFDGITRIGNDSNSGGRTFKGQMDEICIWKRALSRDEIRALRHLTKEEEVENDPDLMVYLQFNEDDGKAFDKSGNRLHTTFNGNTGRAVSPVPVGGGTSEKLIIQNQGTYTSLETGVEISFGSGGTNPDGEIVISRINVQPLTVPSQFPMSRSYWVINNYGNNQSFSGLTDIDFIDIGNTTPITTASDIGLYSRLENSTTVWNSFANASSYDGSSGTAGFSGITLSKFGQFTVDNNTGKGWIGVSDKNWDNPLNWGDGIIPSTSDHVVIPAGTPFQPMVNINGGIKSLNLMPGASLYVPLGILFDVN